MIDPVALRAAAHARATGDVDGWSYAPLRRPSEIAGFLVEEARRLVLPLAHGRTLIAHEKRLQAHEFPNKWFEATWVVTLVTASEAMVADARATNGATLRGVRLPLSQWSEVDPVALTEGI